LQHYDNLFTFSAMNVGYNAFLEMPLTIATAIMAAFTIPAALVIEHRRLLAQQGFAAGLVSLTGGSHPGMLMNAPLQAGQQLPLPSVAATWLASFERLLGLPLGFLISAATKCAVCLCIHVGSQLLVNGPRMLARHNDSSAFIHPVAGKERNSDRHTRTSSTAFVKAATPSARPLSHAQALAARIEAWTATSPVMHALLSPVRLPQAWEDAELKFFAAALALAAPRVLVPMACLPTVLYTLIA
jgi:hypothetical protein